MPTRAYLHLRWNAYRLVKPRAFPTRQTDRHVETRQGYSLKPFDDTHSLFIHIPKCAGVSICRNLYGNLAGGHTTLSQYIEIFEPACMLHYFKFTIVRNPWDRLVSAYHFLKAGGFSPKDKRWFDAELGKYESFLDFVRYWVCAANIYRYHHFTPQCHYFLDKHHQVPLDFLGFFENLDSDFKTIADNVNPDWTKTLQNSNASHRGAYMDYYDDETKDIVAEVYANDIDVLGYTFDNSCVARQIEIRNLKYGACM